MTAHETNGSYFDQSELPVANETSSGPRAIPMVLVSDSSRAACTRQSICATDPLVGGSDQAEEASTLSHRLLP